MTIPISMRSWNDLHRIPTAVHRHRDSVAGALLDDPRIAGYGQLPAELGTHDQSALLTDVVGDVDERDPLLACHAHDIQIVVHAQGYHLVDEITIGEDLHHELLEAHDELIGRYDGGTRHDRGPDPRAPARADVGTQVAALGFDVQLTGVRNHRVQLFPGVDGPVGDDMQLSVLTPALQRGPEGFHSHGVLADQPADLDVVFGSHRRGDVLILAGILRRTKGMPGRVSQKAAGVLVFDQDFEARHPVGLPVLERGQEAVDVRSVAAHFTSPSWNLQISSMTAKGPGSVSSYGDSRSSFIQAFQRW